ncbi:growth arrest and DNA damage-inducible proteins-interacting protein CRIF [Calliopsis andreniformis]|uniref:growth arrest and DNA damage-inducible proteins-interacting protein CRIF n=1 Tax=Calliopsis andreniformis TaxID=337506 RepID=UPI003FCCF8AE
MSLGRLFTNLSLTLRCQSIIGKRCFVTKDTKDIVTSAEEEPVFLKEEKVDMEHKRNKSRLRPVHRNILLGQKPYDEPIMWHHERVKYKKRILGKYGMEALGVPAGLAWPTPEEVADVQEYERVAFPLTLQERWAKIEEEHRRKEEQIAIKQKEIETAMGNMHNMIAEVRSRLAKKTAEAEEAKRKKERRLQEVRYQLSLKGQVTHEKINEMLVKLDKEEKKKKKELKKQRMIERQNRYIMTEMPIEKPIEPDVNTVEKPT